MHHSGTELIDPFAVLEECGVREGWCIADMGCGALGHFVFPAAELVGGLGKVYAVDIQKSVLQAIEKTAKHEQYWNVFPVWSDIDVEGAARILPRSLDLTIVANNLYLSHNRAGLQKECLRLTKAGGLILVIEWKKEPTAIGPSQEHRLSEEEAKACFTHHDLACTRSFDAGDHHYALLFQKLAEDPVTEILAESRPM